MPSVLFVCTGNMCRSPIAAAFFRAQLSQMHPNWRSWRVDSAGTWTHDGLPTSPQVIQVMGRRGIDLSSHRTREVTEAMLAEYDLIITMESGQKEALVVEFTRSAQRVFMLSEMAGRQMDVVNPDHTSVSDVEDTADELETWLARIYSRVVQLAEQNARKRGEIVPDLLA